MLIINESVLSSDFIEFHFTVIAFFMAPTTFLVRGES